jgi:hypothetical protein
MKQRLTAAIPEVLLAVLLLLLSGRSAYPANVDMARLFHAPIQKLLDR